MSTVKCPVCRKEVPTSDMRANPFDGSYMDICVKCEQHYKVDAVRKDVAQPFIDQFSKFVNGGGSTNRKTLITALAESFACEHRYLQAEMITFTLSLLEEIGKRSGDRGYEDGRNEHALLAAKNAAAAAYKY